MSRWQQHREALAKTKALDAAHNKATAEPLPIGTRIDLEIKKAEEKETNAGGLRILLRFEVQAPEEHIGHVLFEGINVICPGSEDAERIGLETLTRISLAAGLEECVDALSDLIGRTVRAEVTGYDEYQGNKREELRGWEPSGVEGKPLNFADSDIPF